MPNLPPTIQIHPTPLETGAATLPGEPTTASGDDVVPAQLDATFRGYTTALGKTLPAYIAGARGYISRMHRAGR